MQRTITHELDRIRDLATSVRHEAGPAAATLDPSLSSVLEEGESINGVGTLLTGVVRWIETDEDELKVLEKKQRSAERRLSQLRTQRDDQQKTLYGKTQKVRMTFEEGFGRGQAEIYLGLGPRMIDLRPVVMQRNAAESVEVLSSPDFETPKPEIPGIWEDPAGYAEEIRKALDPFTTTLTAVADQEKAVESIRADREDLFARLRHRLTWSFRLVEAIYRLAGLEYQADRLRSTIPSSSASPVVTEGDQPSADDPAPTESEDSPPSP